jgi:DNA topoisomerase-2
VQEFSDNMGTKGDPLIGKCKANENWTKVTFSPDLEKFHMSYLEDDVVALMSKRVLDIAGCLGKTVKVELNGQRLPIKSFQDYVGLYLASAAKSDRDEPLPRLVRVLIPEELYWPSFRSVQFCVFGCVTY